MRTSISRAFARAAVVAVATTTTLHAQGGPPVRSLGPVVARASVGVAQPGSLIALPGGRVFVVDSLSKRALLLDSALSSPVVVFDSSRVAEHPLPVGAFVVPYRGDSAVLIDRASSAMIVIAPDGTAGRALAIYGYRGIAPTAGGMRASSTLGFIYHSSGPRVSIGEPTIDRNFGPLTRSIDTSVVWRVDYTTRQVDTIARIWRGSESFRDSTGRGVSGSTSLFPFADDVVATTDGSIGVFRAREYRFDWITAAGARVAGEPIPFAWRPIPAPMRTYLIDSIGKARDSVYQSLVAKRRADSVARGGPPMTTVNVPGPDGTPIPTQRVISMMPPPRRVAADEIPDRFPAAVPNSLRADAENRVWIRSTTPSAEPGYAIWDVVSRERGLVDRVAIPTASRVVGFHPGYVYLAVVSAGAGPELLKVKIRR